MYKVGDKVRCVYPRYVEGVAISDRGKDELTVQKRVRAYTEAVQSGQVYVISEVDNYADSELLSFAGVESPLGRGYLWYAAVFEKVEEESAFSLDAISY